MTLKIKGHNTYSFSRFPKPAKAPGSIVLILLFARSLQKIKEKQVQTDFHH